MNLASSIFERAAFGSLKNAGRAMFGTNSDAGAGLMSETGFALSGASFWATGAVCRPLVSRIGEAERRNTYR